jgi:hypothetical protein
VSMSDWRSEPPTETCNDTMLGLSELAVELRSAGYPIDKIEVLENAQKEIWAMRLRIGQSLRSQPTTFDNIGNR